MTSGGPEVAVLHGQRTRVYDIGFGPEPERVVAAGGDGAVRLWNAEPTMTIKVPGEPWLIDLSPDSRTLLTSSNDGAVRLWNASSGERAGRLPGEEGPVVGEFAPQSGRVLVAGAGPTVRLWDDPQDETIVRLSDDRLDVAAANFDATEERIVYVDTEGRIIIRDLASGREVTLEGGPQAVYDAQFSADGQRVAIHPEDGILRVWRIDRPERPERVLRGHRGNINGLAYGRDGRIATAGADGTVRIWPAEGSRPLVLRGHTQEVSGVAWSGDQATVMTTSPDGTLRVWNSRTGEPMARLVSSDVGLWHLAVSRDGKIAYLDENGVVRIIPLRRVRRPRRGRRPGALPPPAGPERRGARALRRRLAPAGGPAAADAVAFAEHAGGRRHRAPGRRRAEVGRPRELAGEELALDRLGHPCDADGRVGTHPEHVALVARRAVVLDDVVPEDAVVLEEHDVAPIEVEEQRLPELVGNAGLFAPGQGRGSRGTCRRRRPRGAPRDLALRRARLERLVELDAELVQELPESRALFLRHP